MLELALDNLFEERECAWESVKRRVSRSDTVRFGGINDA